MRLPTWLKEIKWFVQRGVRGWADCDWWNLDSYICNIMIGAGYDMLYNGCHLGCGSDILEVLNDPEARAVHNLYKRMFRFFEIHKMLQDNWSLAKNKQLMREYKASGILLIRNFGRLWD